MDSHDVENTNEMFPQIQSISELKDSNETLIMLFDSFKNSSYYTDTTKIDISWLDDRISSEELEELERYIFAMLLDNEEETFISSSKFFWNLYKELSINA